MISIHCRCTSSRYPGLRHVPWVRADVRAGECLYVPVNWFHQVASDEDTFGINFWWTAFDRGAPSSGPSNGNRNRGSNNDQHLPPGNGQNDGLTADPAADADPTGDAGDRDGGHSKGGANAHHAAYVHTTLDHAHAAYVHTLAVSMKSLLCLCCCVSAVLAQDGPIIAMGVPGEIPGFFEPSSIIMAAQGPRTGAYVHVSS